MKKHTYYPVIAVMTAAFAVPAYTLAADEPGSASSPSATSSEQRSSGQTQQGQMQSQQNKAGGQSLRQMTVNEIEGKAVHTRQGEKIGSVERVVRGGSASEELSAVVQSGGFLGMGGKEVLIPLGQLNIEQDHLVATGVASKRDVEQLATFNEEQHQAIEGAQKERPLGEFARFEESPKGQSQQGGSAGQSGQNLRDGGSPAQGDKQQQREENEERSRSMQ